SWMVGDILNDVEAGSRAGCRTVLINNGNETEWKLAPHRAPDLISSNLFHAAQRICAFDRTLEARHDGAVAQHAAAAQAVQEAVRLE
ncbi:MAG: HAD hydrolase-like protein, partial [Burkholderiaceae bacterium]